MFSMLGTCLAPDNKSSEQLVFNAMTFTSDHKVQYLGLLASLAWKGLQTNRVMLAFDDSEQFLLMEIVSMLL